MTPSSKVSGQFVNPHPSAGNTTHTAPANLTYFPALDGLRAIAFLMVFGQHYLFLPWGFTGVEVFFVLSGFLITGILFDTQDTPHRFRNFYVRRALRIFPLYYGIALILLLLVPFLRWMWDPMWLAWPLYLGNFLRFLSPAYQIAPSLKDIADAHLRTPLLPALEINFGHFWSLCVEEQFYLVWPAVVYFVRGRRALMWICGVMVVAVAAARVVAAARAPAWMLDAEICYRLTPFALDALLLGGLLALIWRGAHRAALETAARWATPVLLTLTGVYLCYTMHRYWHEGSLRIERPGMIPYDYAAWHFTAGLPWVDLLTAGVLICALQPGNPIYRVLNLPFLRWIGRISYGLYIFHDMFHSPLKSLFAPWAIQVLHIDYRPGRENLLTAVGALFYSTMLAWLSFTLFESRVLNLKERWAPRTPR